MITHEFKPMLALLTKVAFCGFFFNIKQRKGPHLTPILLPPFNHLLSPSFSAPHPPDEPAPRRHDASRSQLAFPVRLLRGPAEDFSPGEREQGVFCYRQRRRKKNGLLRDMSEIKSV